MEYTVKSQCYRWKWKWFFTPNNVFSPFIYLRARSFYYIFALMTDTIRKTNWIHFESRAKAKNCRFFLLFFAFAQFKWLGMKQWKRFCHRFSSLRFFHLSVSAVLCSPFRFVTLVLFVIRSRIRIILHTFIFVSLQLCSRRVSSHLMHHFPQ